MRRIPIRMKLAAALAVPLIGLFFITVVEVAETAADVDDVRAQTELALIEMLTPLTETEPKEA